MQADVSRGVCNPQASFGRIINRSLSKPGVVVKGFGQREAFRSPEQKMVSRRDNKGGIPMVYTRSNVRCGSLSRPGVVVKGCGLTARVGLRRSVPQW